MKVRTSYLLLLLCIVPLLGGAMRLIALGAPEPSPEEARHTFVAIPLVLHIVFASIYSVLGVVQFDHALRRQHPIWHRASGRVVAASGLIAALSGLWLTLVSDIPTSLQGPLLYWVRLAVSVGMAVSLLQGVLSIVRGQVSAHRAWMIRAYAIGQGAGTQVLLLLPPALLMDGDVTGLTRDILMVAAWGLNLLIAEVVIHRRVSWRGALQTRPI